MNWGVFLPLMVFIIIIFIVGLWANKHVKSSTSFLQEYFLGSRSLGGFILAMTMMATYGSASSFIGGPGVAYSTGLGWVLLSMAQLPAGYFVLMILGKKFPRCYWNHYLFICINGCPMGWRCLAN